MRENAKRHTARRHGCAPGRVTAVAVAALLHAGCSTATDGLGQAPLPYQHANAFSNAGYAESILGPDRYRIEVKGPLNTPREHLEKIAATRAAEIGRDNRLGYFKIDAVHHSTHCETFKPSSRSPASAGGARKLGYAMATADVTYAKTPADPTYRDSRKTFTALRAELDQPQPASAGPATGGAPQVADAPTCG